MTATRSGRIAKRILQILWNIERMNPDYLKHNLDYMYTYVYMICTFVKFLDEPFVIICLGCHPAILSACLILFRILYIPQH